MDVYEDENNTVLTLQPAHEPSYNCRSGWPASDKPFIALLKLITASVLRKGILLTAGRVLARTMLDTDIYAHIGVKKTPQCKAISSRSVSSFISNSNIEILNDNET